MTQRGNSLKDRVQNILRESLKVLAGQENTTFYQNVVKTSERLQEPMQLAIIGKICSSKSTLVNALLGENEIVKTGYMEETYNVSWLKYGDPNSDITVVFKNGNVEKVPKANWGDWASHQSSNRLKSEVRYIEVFHNHDILKEINIIDTPGLDAKSGIDSENTIAFLKEVRPDAVVMLFAKSIAENTLAVVQDFQNCGDGTYNLSPLNAIGVLSKVDLNWSIGNSDKDIIADSNRVIKTTLYDKYPQVRKSLFSILPVSALMGLTSSTVNDEDLRDIMFLSRIEEPIRKKMFLSPEFFASDKLEVDISPEKRRYLCNKFGLYGIFVLSNVAKRNKDITISMLKEALLQKSGFGTLQQTIKAHFGGRSILIKSQTILQDLLRQVISAKSKSTGEALKGLCAFENIMVSTILSMHEYREWECLAKYYDGKLDLDEQMATEFTALFGENGYSAKERLQMSHAGCSAELIKRATDRALYWQGQYNLFSTIAPEMAKVYRVVVSSYNQLIKAIRMAERDYKVALEKLRQSEYFLGINEYQSTES